MITPEDRPRQVPGSGRKAGAGRAAGPAARIVLAAGLFAAAALVAFRGDRLRVSAEAGAQIEVRCARCGRTFVQPYATYKAAVTARASPDVGVPCALCGDSSSAWRCAPRPRLDTTTGEPEEQPGDAPGERPHRGRARPRPN